MGKPQEQQHLDEAFDQIEGTILPRISMMLESLLDAGRRHDPRQSRQDCAAQLQAFAHQLEQLTKQTETIGCPAVRPISRIGTRA